MALDTYENLITSIAKWSKRTDIADFIPDFITLTEKRINSGLRMKDNEKRAIATLAKDDKYIVLPTNFVEMRALRVIDGSYYRDLVFSPPESMKFSTQAGRPRFFTVNNKLEFDCIPDKNYRLEMTYFYGITPLGVTETTQSNNVLRLYPNLYLYGALAEVSRWSLDTDTANYWDSLYSAVLETANAKEKKGRYGPAPAPIYEGRIP